MIRYNKRIMKEVKCAVCNSPVMVDEGGNGDVCENCGWRQDAASNKIPGNVWGANQISLDKAKKLYKEGKPFVPDFDDFIEFCETYGEVEFVYDGLRYAVERGGSDSFLFGTNPSDVFSYVSIEEFIEKAEINNSRLKDLWDKIGNFQPM